VNSPRGAGRGDLIISNEGQGLFGAARASSNEQFGRVVAANLVGSIQLIRSVLPHLRAQGGGPSRRLIGAIYELHS
jgi:NAD(P)-dependent dehydrogenase (short-subunit alcohol dehydrogenase family)